MDEVGRLIDALKKLHLGRYDVVIANDWLSDGSGRELLLRARYKLLVRNAAPLCRRALIWTDDVRRHHFFGDPRAEDEAYERLFRQPHELSALVAWLDEIRYELD